MRPNCIVGSAFGFVIACIIHKYIVDKSITVGVVLRKINTIGICKRTSINNHLTWVFITS